MQLCRRAGGELDDVRPRRVSDLLREGFDGFSRSQKAVARYIIDHLEEVGLSERRGAGAEGQHLELHGGAVRPVSRLRRLSRAAEGGPGRIPTGRHGASGGPRRPAWLLHRGGCPHSLAQDRRAESRRDHQQEHPGALQPGGGRSGGAGQVLVVGLHEAAVVAEHASYVFELLGIPCVAVTDSTEVQRGAAGRLGQGDVLLAIGFQARPLGDDLLRAEGAPPKARRSSSSPTTPCRNWRTRATSPCTPTSTPPSSPTRWWAPSVWSARWPAAVYRRDRDLYDARVRAVRDKATESGWLR